MYVSRYPEFEQQRRLSTCEAVEPLWSPAGDELFYQCGRRWLVTNVTTGSDFSAGSPRELFETPFVDTFGLSYDIAPDGWFLIPRPAEAEPDTRQIRVVLNWHQELRARVPIP